ncbi:MAG: SH3 domain-containing protein [Alphaproteobacteria bacterium]|nr:MAG: SH3 domain-containing protein [Alphaproteobacteria bacterium]
MTAETSCAVRGFATDRDPKGSNIRSQPRATAPIVGRLPPLFPLTSADIVGAEFEIIGSKNGWLLIRNADAAIDKQGNGKRVFKGPGWISGRLAGATLGMPELRAAPNRDAAIVARLYDADKGWGPDSFGVTRIHACDGDYVDRFGAGAVLVHRSGRSATERFGYRPRRESQLPADARRPRCRRELRDCRIR